MREYILSIDASLSSTGWAVIDKSSKDVVDLGRITTKPKIAEDDRIMVIVNTLLEIRAKYSINEICMEDGYMYKNMKTGMQLTKLRGGIIVAMKLTGSNIAYMQPGEIRKTLLGQGRGNAPKEDVAQAIIDMYPNNIHVQALGPFSDKNNKAKNSDMYDAVSIGVAYIMAQQVAEESQTA